METETSRPLPHIALHPYPTKPLMEEPLGQDYLYRVGAGELIHLGCKEATTDPRYKAFLIQS